MVPVAYPTLLSTLNSLRSTLHALRSMLNAQRSTLNSLRSKLFVLRSTLYAQLSTLNSLRSTLYAQLLTLYASSLLPQPQHVHCNQDRERLQTIPPRLHRHKHPAGRPASLVVQCAWTARSYFNYRTGVQSE